MVRVKRKIKDRPILGPSFIEKLLKEDYNYRTGNVNGTDIFDITKTGMTFYNQLLPSADDETKRYMENRKGIVGHIEYMTPQEYYDHAAKIHRTTANNLKWQRDQERDIIDKLKDVITNKKKKFPITFLSFSKNYRGQEGLHRMYAAAELFGWDDVKFPVLVIEDTSWIVAEKMSNINIKEKNFKRSEKSLELNEVYPNKGESKKDFISRFMSVTKDEYPDRKQRYAVALSYWNRRNENLTEEKIAYLPKEHIDAINNRYKDYYKNYSIEKVAISDLLRDDPGLDDYNDLGSYHEIIWGDDISKYSYDPEKNINPSDVPSVVYKNGKYHISDGRHRIKALANSGYDYVELPVLRESVLNEAKEDIEKFVAKFGQETYDWFVKSKDRLKNNKISTDILYHVKNTSVEDMQNILHNLQSKLKSDDLTKIQGEYKYLGEFDSYKVYQPLDALASMNLGVGSGWCTTGRYGHYGDVNFKPSVADAKKHWYYYTKRGIKFYYLLDAKTMLAKYAIAVYPRVLKVDNIVSDYYIEQTNFEIYNAEDKIDYDAYFKLENVLKLIPESLIFKSVNLGELGDTVEAVVENNIVKSSKLYSYSSVTTVIIPKGTMSIGSSVFLNCSNLTDIVIPDSVTSIGVFSFSGCTNLTSIEIPNSVTDIGSEAFSGCTNLTSIEIPNSVTRLGGGAFEHCSNLETIKLSTSLINIEPYVFFNCGNLTNIELPNSLKSIGKKAFWGCADLTDITIPDSVTSIEEEAFGMCNSLIHVKMSDNVKNISRFTFGDCSSLKNMELSNSVINIGEYAFSGCSSLTSIIIPESVTSISPFAFADCQNLTIYCEAVKKPDGWKRNWNPDKRPVLRGYKGEAKQEKLSSNKKKSHSILTYNAGDVTAGIAMFNHAAAAESLNENDYTNLSSTQLENLLFNDLFSEKNLTDTFKSINILPAVMNNVPKGPSFITRDGKFIDVMRTSDFIDRSKFTDRFSYSALTHYDWLKLIVKALFGSKLKAYRDMLEIVTDKLGWVRCNTGESPEEDRFYCVVPDRSESRMTPKQYDSLEKYLTYGKNKNKEVLVFGGDTGNTSNIYSLKDPYYIIEKIKDYYRTGILMENVQFSNNALWRMGKYVDIIKNKNTLALLDGRDTPICYASAINNLFYFHRLGKDCILHLGTFDETGNTIVHAWVECEGKIYQTAEPKNKPKNYKLKSLKQINISKDMSEDDIEEAVKSSYENTNKSLNEITRSEMRRSFQNNDNVSGNNPEKIVGKYNYLGEKDGYKIYQPLNYRAIKSLNSLDKDKELYPEDKYDWEYITQTEKAEIYYILNAKTLVPEYTILVQSKVDDVKQYYDPYYIYRTNIEIHDPNTGSDDHMAYFKLKNILDLIPNDLVFEYEEITVGDEMTAETKGTVVIPSVKYFQVKHIIIPEGVTEISDHAFHGCKKLTSVSMPSTVTRIGTSAFSWCPNLVDIELPDSIEYIGPNAFYDCGSLTSIKISEKIKEIYDGTFGFCNNLKNIELPDSLISIGESAFCYCGRLISINLPESLVYIGDTAFEGCSRLESIKIPNNIENVGKRAFSQCGFTDLTIPGTLINISRSMFSMCSHLTNVKILNGVTSIGNWAFSTCRNLKNIEIPNSVTSIGREAFSECSTLESIIIPNSVTNIGGEISDRCFRLTIYCEAESQPEGWDRNWNSGKRPVVWGYKSKKTESLNESVEIHDTLNSKFWKDNELKTEVREKIEAIVERFKTYLNDKNIKIDVKDILLLGSNASYNYTDDSDLDIHIIVEPGEITENEELLKQLYDLAASAFNDKFNITLKNSDAEIYVELKDTDAHSNGIYSLEKGWIKEPVKDELKNVELDKEELNKWKKRYLSTLKEKDAKKIKKFIAELYKLRKDSIAADGEYSQGNIIFKEMRNLGYISKLKELLDEIESKELSLEKLNEAKEDIEKFIDKFGQDIYDWFIKSKDRLKNNKISTDILYHVKNTSVEDMQNILHNLQAKTGAGDLTKIQGKYNYLGEKNGYKIYQPLNAIASMNLGIGSGWCTTGRYGHYGDINFKPSLKDAERHWNKYTETGIKFYYLLDAKTMLAKYAIALYPRVLEVNKIVSDYLIEQTNFEIYNAWDNLDYDAYFSLKGTLEQIPDLNLLFKSEKIEETIEAIVEKNTVIRSAKYLKTKNIVIPNNATTIGDSAFKGCTNLTEITIPNSVTSIGTLAFVDCKKLKTIELPDSVTGIGDYAFMRCYDLKSIKIPNSVTSIGTYAFATCTALTSIVLSGSITSIEDGAFKDCESLTGIEIPDSVTSIGDSAFSGCTSLTNIEIPSSVTNIGDNAFLMCSYLESIKLSDSLTRIEDGAFFACSKLKTVIIPNSVSYIGYYAFDRCPNLTIYCEAESQPEGWDRNWNSGKRPVVWGYKGK